MSHQREVSASSSEADMRTEAMSHQRTEAEVRADSLRPKSPTKGQKKLVKKTYRGFRAAVEVDEGFDQTFVRRYNASKFSSSMVLLFARGTVLSNWVLWTEQLLVMIVYFLLAIFSAVTHDEKPTDLIEALRTFLSNSSTLAAFLLGLYTALSVARWWRLRTEGIGNIWSSASQLCMYISECVTRDEQVLKSILRYARASLAMRFLQRRYPGRLSEKLQQLVSRRVLTMEEVQKLKAYNNNLAESIWTWVTRIVVNLHRKGDIESEIMLNFLLEKVAIGRSGAALIGAQMGTPIPLPYVHLLCLLVKIHNYAMALGEGFILAAAGHASCSDCGGTVGLWAVVTAKVFLTTFLYNSILLINAELADPFCFGMNDFPLSDYERGIETDGLSYLEAGDNAPEWMHLP